MSLKLSPFAVVLAAACATSHASPEARIARATTYSCVVSALRASSLPVTRADSASGEVIATLKEDAPAAATQGTFNPTLSRDDTPSPYLIDIVRARVTNDRAGHATLDVHATSGAGAGPRSGYVERPASERARKAADAASACATVASNGGGPSSSSR